MTSLPSIPDGEHDSSRSDTPLASYRLSAAVGRTIPASIVLLPDAKPISTPPLYPAVSTEPIPAPLLLPLTALSPANVQVSVTQPESVHDIRTLDPLPLELASADIFFAREFISVSNLLLAARACIHCRAWHFCG